MRKNPYIAEYGQGAETDGACFICLEGPRRRGRVPLVSCCSQCSALTHVKCWSKWRRKQRLATLRARLLATNITDPLMCSICKTGLAQIPQEADLGWTAHGGRVTGLQQHLQDRLLEIVGRMLQASRGHEDEAVSLPSNVLRQVAICVSAAVCAVVFIDSLIFILCDITYWGMVVLPSLAILYLISSLSCAFLAIYQRKLVLGPLGRRPPDIVPELAPRFVNENSDHLPLEIVEAHNYPESSSSSLAATTASLYPSSAPSALAGADERLHLELWSNAAVLFYV